MTDSSPDRIESLKLRMASLERRIEIIEARQARDAEAAGDHAEQLARCTNHLERIERAATEGD